MGPVGLAARRRRVAGHGAGGVRGGDFAALAAALLSSPAEPAESLPRAPASVAGAAGSVEAAAPRGLYLLVPAGIEPSARRAAVLAAAGRLAPQGRPAAVLIFENGTVDAHVFGELAWGRLGPQTDVDRAIDTLVGQCDPVGIVLLDPLNGELRRLGPAARRTVFMATPDAESVVETYRTLKAWLARTGGAGAAGASDAALLVLGRADDQRVARFHGRLRQAARGFLGCDLAIQGSLAPDLESGRDGRGAFQVLSKAPADQVWPRLLDAAGCGAPHAGELDASVGEAGLPAPAAGHALAPAATAAPAAPGVCPAFSLWTPADRGELAAAIEAQVPSLLGGAIRLVFRVEVDEPDAPPLAAVRNDGGLVAILLPAPGETPDTRAAQRWLAVHRRLLARAYPSAGIAAEATPSAIVLAPLEALPASDGIRRIVPVRLGGHRGIVLVP